MTGSTHFPERTVGGDRNLRALLARAPNRKAVLFAHGWSGDAITTWSDFHSLLPECPGCHGYDLYFYDYDGLRAEMIASVGLFREVLEQLGEDPASLVNPALDNDVRRPTDFAYDKIVIVAHSLGAVLARWAIIDGIKLKSKWPARTKCVFYAPAHSGADVVKLASEALSGFGSLQAFVTGVKIVSPLIRQLETDSKWLRRLAREAKKAFDAGHESVRAAKVFIADYEKIVSNLPFEIDPPSKTIQNTTHTSICKPKSTFRAPIDLLLKEL